jgi:hypothetical protein
VRDRPAIRSSSTVRLGPTPERRGSFKATARCGFEADALPGERHFAPAAFVLYAASGLLVLFLVLVRALTYGNRPQIGRASCRERV